MQPSFDNKTVIVTGASSGIGRSTALAFLNAGARVVLAARRADLLQALTQELAEPDRHRALAIPTDITQPDQVTHMFARAMERFGRVDILVNNAGFGMRASVEETKMADARQLMEVNFFSALQCIQEAVPIMKRQGGGQIVNVGSILSLIATPNNAIYSASKFAIRALSDALRIELRHDHIDVILIMPGYTETPFFDNMIRHHGPARTTDWKGQSPDKVARVILRACARRRREEVLTIPAKMGALVKRISPRFVDWMMVRIRH
jgi:short-subunit dehydrogenase